MKPITVRVTKYEKKRDGTVLWPLVMKITEEESRKVFRVVNNAGFINTERQFAKFIYNDQGPGNYGIYFYRKGWFGAIHLKIECRVGEFRRTPAKSKEEKESKKEREKIKKMMKKSMNRTLLAEIDFSRDVVTDHNETIKEQKSLKRSIFKYIKPCNPPFAWHPYASSSEAPDKPKTWFD